MSLPDRRPAPTSFHCHTDSTASVYQGASSCSSAREERNQWNLQKERWSIKLFDWECFFSWMKQQESVYLLFVAHDYQVQEDCLRSTFHVEASAVIQNTHIITSSACRSCVCSDVEKSSDRKCFFSIKREGVAICQQDPQRCYHVPIAVGLPQSTQMCTGTSCFNSWWNPPLRSLWDV